MRFDEIELDAVPLVDEPAAAMASHHAAADDAATGDDAPRGKRLLALLTDLSLFVAIVLALSPLLPSPASWLAITALAGFVLVLSYHYFVGTWLLWGKTIGGAIFDVKIARESMDAMSWRSASLRWAATLASLATAGIGFALAALPSRRSLPDRMSATRCVVGT
ncbi:MAG TPA: RDD family protein [Thermoanaerobaculia bacterium]|nr:RDD family protein [Thermoanaerobaculia bacterium]